MDRTRRATIFGEVAELYERVRPPYPEVVIDAAVERMGRARGGRVLEVGAGTGKATAQFLARQLTVVAVEPDRRMAAVAEAKLGHTGRLHLHVGPFETWDGDDASFDLVVAAQAWHWVDPAVGYRKARAALHPAGILALLWNRSLVEGRPPGVTDAYRRHAPHLAEGSTLDRSWPADGRSRQVAESGLFTTPEVLTWRWTRWCDTATYLDLLRTHSDHRILPDDVRAALLADIGEVLDAHGGGIEIPYVSEALIARPV